MNGTLVVISGAAAGTPAVQVASVIVYGNRLDAVRAFPASPGLVAVAGDAGVAVCVALRSPIAT